MLAAGAIVGAVALAALANTRGSVSIALAGGVGLPCLVAAVVYAHRHRDSVITALLLTEMLSAHVFMPVEFSTATHYTLNFNLFKPDSQLLRTAFGFAQSSRFSYVSAHLSA